MIVLIWNSRVYQNMNSISKYMNNVFIIESYDRQASKLVIQEYSSEHLKGQITISYDPSPLFGIQFLAIPFAFDFAFKMHIKEKSFKHSIN